MSSDVQARIAALCDDAVHRMADSPVRTAVRTVREKLDQPLQVTVAGGVSSGKSTLVNALLGQRIAAVDASECTRVVTRYRYGHHERAEVHLHDGSTRTLQLVGGTLPSELGVPLDSVAHVVVHLSNAGLQQLAIVDTPGLNTVTSSNEVGTEQFLGIGTPGPTEDRAAHDTAAAIGEADALLFLMPHLRRSDATVLASFRDLYQGTGLSAFNAAAVLSKIDRLTRDGDPVAAAAPIAERVRQETRGLVSAVLPVIGLLAETASTAGLSEADARALGVLAEWGDDLDREDLLMSPDSFVSMDGPDVESDQRRHLLERLDLYGLGVAMDAIDNGARGAAPLLELLSRRSGFAPLRDHVLDQLGRHSELIKANNALCDLRRVSYTRTSGPDDDVVLAQLRSELDRVELDPTLHHLRVVQVLTDVGNGELRLPEPLLGDLERLVTGTDPCTRTGAAGPEEISASALAGAARWARFGNDPRRRPADARRARTVKEAYELLWSQHASAVART